MGGESAPPGGVGPLPGSGKHVTSDVIDFCRFRDGKLAEHWRIPDRVGILEHVGMSRSPRRPMKLMAFASTASTQAADWACHSATVP